MMDDRGIGPQASNKYRFQADQDLRRQEKSLSRSRWLFSHWFIHHLRNLLRSSGWWFGTFFIFPYIGNSHPNWLIFFRGVESTNQSYFDLFLSSPCANPRNFENYATGWVMAIAPCPFVAINLPIHRITYRSLHDTFQGFASHESGIRTQQVMLTWDQYPRILKGTGG